MTRPFPARFARYRAWSTRRKREVASSSRPSSTIPAEIWRLGITSDRLPLDRKLETPEEEFGILERRLREDHGEFVAADAAGDVCAAHHEAQALRDLGEHSVTAEMADLLVDRLEVVEVEEEQASRRS